MGTEDLTSVLDAGGARYDLLPHAHTESATAEAEALGLAPADVAKTLVVATPQGYVRAVLPASERIDLGKLSEIVGERKKTLRLASEDDLARDYAEFELGAVPPVGGARGATRSSSTDAWPSASRSSSRRARTKSRSASHRPSWSASAAPRSRTSASIPGSGGPNPAAAEAQ